MKKIQIVSLLGISLGGAYCIYSKYKAQNLDKNKVLQIL